MVLAGVGLGPKQESAGARQRAETAALVIPTLPQLAPPDFAPPSPKLTPVVASTVEQTRGETVAAISAVRSSSAMPVAYVRHAAARLRPALQSCWDRATEGAAPDGSPTLWAEVVFDRRGHAERAKVQARGRMPGGLANCVQSKLVRMRTAHRPYAAHGRASFAIRFELRAAGR